MLNLSHSFVLVGLHVILNFLGLNLAPTLVLSLMLKLTYYLVLIWWLLTFNSVRHQAI